ncbi:E3 ubiquitin-protein ligase RNF25 [Halyomorpha halys]|uniref:E3 ubiquitin-protein ligase RNF25 n=1 Tax=Halyomorpha halys TaxID=286706 RepID=UPI0006D511DC|nr:E3 ubiquitin-protein ligase RNF25 [Halyomorpha halys]
MHDDERVTEELSALQAIFDEIKIKTDDSGNAVGVELEVHPCTALDTEQQYVRLTLQVTLTKGYPDVKPNVTLANPRGLDESLLKIIQKEVSAKCTENLGQPVLFDILEIVKERLTASNIPSVPCCICLYGFREGDQFTKTDCYHYFHSRCLAGHLTASEASYKEEQDKLPPWQRGEEFQAVCPICRAHICFDVEVLKAADPPLELEEAPVFEPTPELRKLQESMSRLYLKQYSKGGIIQPINKTVFLSEEESNGEGTNR